MTCSLAVSITKAVVTDEHLKDLLNKNPQEVERLLVQYFKQKYPNEAAEVRSTVQGRDVYLYVNEGYFLIQDGRVIDRDGDGARFFNELQQLVGVVADKLFADEVEASLKKKSRVVKRELKTVTTAGKKKQQATVFTAKVGQVDMRVFALQGGKMEVFVDSGSFAQAKLETLKLFDGLKVDGIDIKRTSDVEQHKAGGMAHVHVHTHQA